MDEQEVLKAAKVIKDYCQRQVNCAKCVFFGGGCKCEWRYNPSGMVIEEVTILRLSLTGGRK